MSKDNNLTIKQRKWLKLYLECGNATEAAMQVYDCKDRDVAKSIGSENLTKLDYSDFMEEAGITDIVLQQKIMEGLGATKQIGARKIVQGARTAHEIKVDASTETDDFIEVEDYAIRHKYLETALKLKKRLIDAKEPMLLQGTEGIIIFRPAKNGKDRMASTSQAGISSTANGF